jgi:hypothetical protein
VPGWHVAYPLAGIGVVALFALVAERSRPRAQPMRSSSISSLFGIDGKRPTRLRSVPQWPDLLPFVSDVRARAQRHARTHAQWYVWIDVARLFDSKCPVRSCASC